MWKLFTRNFLNEYYYSQLGHGEAGQDPFYAGKTPWPC